MSRFRQERGESALELVLWVVGSVGLLAGAGYAVLWARSDRSPHLTLEEQAYVQAVATQQADAYIRAVATQQAQAAAAPAPVPAVSKPPAAPVQQPAAPPPAAPAPTNTSRPYVPPPAPVPTNTPLPYIPPPAPVPTTPPPPPPPPPLAKPPMATCVGYMVGLTPTGLEACNQVTQDTSWDVRVRNCIYDIIVGNAQTGAGQADCLGASLSAGDPNLSDCFLGLSGQSLYGRTSCRQYYGSH